MVNRSDFLVTSEIDFSPYKEIYVSVWATIEGVSQTTHLYKVNPVSWGQADSYDLLSGGYANSNYFMYGQMRCNPHSIKGHSLWINGADYSEIAYYSVIAR